MRRSTETVMTNQEILGKQLSGISQIAAINLPAVEHLRRNSVLYAKKGTYHHFL